MHNFVSFSPYLAVFQMKVVTVNEARIFVMCEFLWDGPFLKAYKTLSFI